MKPPNHRISRIAQRVMQNIATPQERHELAAWLSSCSEEEAAALLFGDGAETLTGQEHKAAGTAVSLTRAEKDAMLTHILSDAPEERRAPLLSLRHKARLWYAAASILLLVGSAIALWRIGRTRRPLELAYKETRTPNGQHRLIVLPDGTKVYLNAGSRLRYPTRYSDTTREVFLDGEAFFDVAQDKDRPFIVRADHFSARVLGTSFDCRDYGDEPSSCVQLKTGRLEVSLNYKYAADHRQVVTLVPRQQVFFRTGSTQGLAPQPVDEADIGSWTEGRLIFADRSALGILRELERAYAVHFRIHARHGELSRRYTARFEKMNLDKTLETVGLLTGLKFLRTDTVVDVSAQAAARP